MANFNPEIPLSGDVTLDENVSIDDVGNIDLPSMELAVPAEYRRRVVRKIEFKGPPLNRYVVTWTYLPGE